MTQSHHIKLEEFWGRIVTAVSIQSHCFICGRIHGFRTRQVKIASPFKITDPLMVIRTGLLVPVTGLLVPVAPNHLLE